MEVFEAIANRRSVRKYTDKPVADDQIRTILEAAMMAPSAGNAQPWQFVVVRDREILAALKDINPYAAMAARAPLGILVCGDLSLEKYPGYWVQDCSAAIQNMLLTIHGLGLGAVWTGIHPMADRVAGFRKLFKLPDHVVPLGFIIIGHPAQNPTAESRYREDRIHQETW
ncbi:MAG: nitroreductase family protein [Deltaproteobacteria bacterium]|nr:nitroreductase family protein [Deltaproteobacteria bacterium]